MAEQEKKKDTGETKLSDHKRHKKELIPPMLQIPNRKPSSWIHNRLPEMLWAVLVIGNMEREKSLNFFRYIGKYVSKNKDCFDVTISGISKLPPEKAKEFIKHMISWSEEISQILRPLKFYTEMPASEIWNDQLQEPVPDEDWKKVLNGVNKTYNHQSQEATDCRWVKLICFILGGKLKFPSNMREVVKEIFEYPNYGDMRGVRPSIRSSEISLTNDDLSWPKYFWKRNYDSSDCLPEELFSKKIKLRQEELSNEIEVTRDHFLSEIKRVRGVLINHFFKSVDDTTVNPRRENSFGLALYGLVFFTEIIFYSSPSSITGRVALRSLVELYINFKYLLKKEQEEPKIWDDFHDYGTGKAKLIYLKLKEIGNSTKCIHLNELESMVNEDIWVEFTAIHLGQWGNSDLRKMSEYADIFSDFDPRHFSKRALSDDFLIEAQKASTDKNVGNVEIRLLFPKNNPKLSNIIRIIKQPHDAPTLPKLSYNEYYIK
mgnify:CR=1 FL=1